MDVCYRDYPSKRKSHSWRLKKLIDATSALRQCHVGIWTSASRINAMGIIELLKKHVELKLDVLMTREDCEEVKHGECEWATIKDLRRLYSKYPIYAPDRTVIIDDSPFKSHRNPLNAIIIPEWNHINDDAPADAVLGHLCEYIGLMERKSPEDVRVWMRQYPFTITEKIERRVIINPNKDYTCPAQVVYPADGAGDGTAAVPVLDCDELENSASNAGTIDASGPHAGSPPPPPGPQSAPSAANGTEKETDGAVSNLDKLMRSLTLQQTE